MPFFVTHTFICSLKQTMLMGGAGAWGCDHAGAQIKEEAVSPGRWDAADMGPY